MLISKTPLGWYWGIRGSYGRANEHQYLRETRDQVGEEMEQWKGIEIAGGTLMNVSQTRFLEIRI